MAAPWVGLRWPKPPKVPLGPLPDSESVDKFGITPGEHRFVDKFGITPGEHH